VVDIVRVDVTAPDVLQITTAQQNEVTFPITDFDKHLNRWWLVFSKGQEQSRQIASLDLSVSEHVPLRWLEAAAVPPTSSKLRKISPYKKNMFDPSSIIVGLEIGTSKVCAVAGEVNAQGALNIIGVGQARSRGVPQGRDRGCERAVRGHPQCHRRAEQMADVEIRSVYLGVTGGHIHGFNNRGVHPWFRRIAKSPSRTSRT